MVPARALNIFTWVIALERTFFAVRTHVKPESKIPSRTLGIEAESSIRCWFDYRFAILLLAPGCQKCG